MAKKDSKKLVTTDTALGDSEEKKILRQKVQELKSELLLLTEKVEQLKIDLVVIKQEYDIRIGRLYLRMDELDLEILKFKKIEDLLKRNISLEEAKRIVEETLKARQKTIDEEYAKLDEEEEIVEKRKNIPENEKEELKKLWRSLAHKYHPDLARNDEDRKKYEEIMKKINKAYADGDLEALKAIEQEHIEDSDNISAELLKTKLQNIESAIIRLEKEYSMLKKSEWQVWKNNIEVAQKQGRDLLLELEQKLLQDISGKEAILQNYQKQYGPK
jgi:hypothetical protein